MKRIPSKFNQEIEMRLNNDKPIQEQKIDEKPIYEDFSSDSDSGLPPPIPEIEMRKPSGFSLAIGGLGLSTVAKDGEKTAEEMADMQVLKEAKQKPKEKSDSDSDGADQTSAIANINKLSMVPSLSVGMANLAPANSSGLTDERRAQLSKKYSANMQDIKSETENDT